MNCNGGVRCYAELHPNAITFQLCPLDTVKIQVSKEQLLTWNFSEFFNWPDTRLKMGSKYIFL